MKNLKTKTKFNLSNYWLKRSTSMIGVAGISALIGLPVLSQSYYPPMVFFQPLAYPNYPQRNEKVDLVNSLQSNDNFTNLIAELETAGLTEKLQQGQFTVLAPTDDAFNALSDEAFDKFSEPDNRMKVLQYHLIEGEVTQSDIDEGEISTLAGDAIAISHDNENLRLNNDAKAIFPSTTVDNGVIIEIDKVLLPPGF